MLKPTAPHLRRSEIRPGHWRRWLAAGTAGLVGFAVLTLLLVLDPGIGQLDHELLAGVISLRTPDRTAFASAVTRLGSASVAVWLGLAAAVTLGSDHAGSCCPFPCSDRWRQPRAWSRSSRSRSTDLDHLPSSS